MTKDRLMLSQRAEGRPREASSPDRVHGFYLPQLDVLRFFAFLGVFVWHIPPGGLEFFEHHGIVGSAGIAGSFGVDLFFALSAYLITTLLLREQTARGAVDVPRFYVRRALRIWPLYFFFIGLALVLSRFVGWLAVKRSYLAAMSAFVGNFAMARWGDDAGYIGPLWSVSIEEQFYLLWPLFLRRASRRGLVWAAITLFAVACASRMLMWRLGFQARPLWYYTFTRLDPIAAGVLLAAVPIEAFPRRLSSRVALVAIGFAGWLFAAHYCRLQANGPAGFGTTAGYPAVALGAAAFLAAVLGAGKAGGRFLSSRPLIYLGKISYGLYVYHGLAIELTRRFLFGVVLFALLRFSWPLWLGWPIYLGIAFPLTVLMAACSYRWLETPFLGLKQRFTYVSSRPI